MQGLVHYLFPIPAVACLDGALEGVKVSLPMAVLLDHCDHIGQPLADDIEHGRCPVQQWLLLHVGKLDALLPLNGPVVRPVLPRENLQE